MKPVTDTLLVKGYLLKVNRKFYNEKAAWDILLLLIRIWLGYRMFSAGYASVIDIIFHPKERAFFEDWFGKELHFPMPVVIAFTMLVATLVANLGENFVIDGGFTISYFLFSIILVVAGSGKYSLDHLLRKKEKVLFYLNRNN